MNDEFTELYTGIMEMSLEDESLFVPDEDSVSSSDEESEEPRNEYIRKEHLNRFLEICNVQKLTRPRKRWAEAGARTQSNHVKKAKDVIVAALDAITPGDAAHLWDAFQSSMLVDKELGYDGSADRKYLEALAETYKNASAWDTRRQVLSIMADLVPIERLQRYLPGITEYRVKTARLHKHVYGRGNPLPSRYSPRMRGEATQLDHFLTFITSPHITQDLPFGQKYIKLSTREVLETPNLIRSMIPERIVKQYTKYCDEFGFKPFGRTTMLAILAACSATVRKSLQGIDYIAAEGGKACDDLGHVVKRLEEYGVLKTDVSELWRTCVKSAKQYIKSDYKVFEASFIMEQNNKNVNFDVMFLIKFGAIAQYNSKNRPNWMYSVRMTIYRCSQF